MFAGRKVVLTGGPLAALTGVCRRLRELGAERPFLLATGIGTGEVPGPDEAEWCVVEVRAPDVVAEIRAAMGLLRLLPDEVVDALDRWDPERQALVLSPMFNKLPQIAGRRVYGPRRPEWRTFPGAVATFRPVEMVTLRRPGSTRLHYAGAATFWDPPDEDREVMRDLARRVGAGLRQRVGYRGAFTVDGVLAAEGFLPTELNPRLGAGLATMTRDLPDLPVSLLDRALIEGEPLALAADDLERQVLAAADRTRAGGAWTVTERGPSPPENGAADATRELPVVFEGGACRPADGRPADGVLSFGPSGVGGFVRLGLDPARVPAGPPVAPLAVAAFALADERFGTGIGPLAPARAVR